MSSPPPHLIESSPKTVNNPTIPPASLSNDALQSSPFYRSNKSPFQSHPRSEPRIPKARARMHPAAPSRASVLSFNYVTRAGCVLQPRAALTEICPATVVYLPGATAGAISASFSLSGAGHYTRVQLTACRRPIYLAARERACRAINECVCVCVCQRLAVAVHRASLEGCVWVLGVDDIRLELNFWLQESRFYSTI